MLDRCVDSLVAALLLAFFIPLLAWYFIRNAIDSRRSSTNRAELFKIDLLERQIAGQFQFERAIEAYEELIDSTFAEGRP